MAGWKDGAEATLVKSQKADLESRNSILEMANGATPSFRAQLLQSLSQMVQAAPLAYQVVMFPAMVELSDIPNRHELADQFRNFLRSMAHKIRITALRITASAKWRRN